MAASNNYTVGSGKLYFGKFIVGTSTPEGERYIGNTPALSVSSAIQNLEHYSSDEGVQVLDDSVLLRTDRAGKFTTDNISADNVAMMFGSEAATRTVVAASGLSNTLVVRPGMYYQLGTSAAVPEGLGALASATVVDSSGTAATGTLTFGGQPTAADTVTVNAHAITFVAGSAAANQVQIAGSATLTAQALKALLNDDPGRYAVVATGAGTVLTLTAVNKGTGGNAISLAKSGTYPSVSAATLTGGLAGVTIAASGNYEVDLVLGRLYILPAAADIDDGDTIVVTYATTDDTVQLVIDDGAEVIGCLRYVANNTRGDNRNYFWPKVKLTADGEYQLKSQVWLTMAFSFQVLVRDSDTKRTYATV